MTFADLVAGEAIFLDANLFVYHFASDPRYGAACTQLLQRIENQEITGLTSTHVLTEMAHRVMTVEAITAFAWPMTGIARRLRQHPDQVQQLGGFHQAVERVLQSRNPGPHDPRRSDRGGGSVEPADWSAQQRRPDRRRHAGERPDEARQLRSRLRPDTRADAV